MNPSTHKKATLYIRPSARSQFISSPRRSLQPAEMTIIPCTHLRVTASAARSTLGCHGMTAGPINYEPHLLHIWGCFFVERILSDMACDSEIGDGACVRSSPHNGSCDANMATHAPSQRVEARCRTRGRKAAEHPREISPSAPYSATEKHSLATVVQLGLG